MSAILIVVRRLLKYFRLESSWTRGVTVSVGGLAASLLDEYLTCFCASYSEGALLLVEAGLDEDLIFERRRHQLFQL